MATSCWQTPAAHHYNPPSTDLHKEGAVRTGVASLAPLFETPLDYNNSITTIPFTLIPLPQR